MVIVQYLCKQARDSEPICRELALCQVLCCQAPSKEAEMKTDYLCYQGTPLGEETDAWIIITINTTDAAKVIDVMIVYMCVCVYI